MAAATKKQIQIQTMVLLLLVVAWMIVQLYLSGKKIGDEEVSEQTISLVLLSTSATGRTGGGNHSIATTDEVPETRPSIDIISIGSLNKAEFQNAQQRTFGRASVVRNFFRINELNDTEATCYTTLTHDQMFLIKQFCSVREHQSYFSKALNMSVLEKQIPGWICAQKRPIDGLYHVLQRYKLNHSTSSTHMHTIPDYLFIIDDDAYLNMDRLVPDLQKNQNYASDSNKPEIFYGCPYWFFRGDVIYPHGGHGSFLNKKAIERLLQPIYCDNHKVHHEYEQQSSLNCWRIKQNINGEQRFFSDGMSVNELMFTYASGFKFMEVDQWTDVGYCAHSDHILGYFFHFYHIIVPDGTVSIDQQPDDTIRHNHFHSDFPGKSDCNRGPNDRLSNEFRVYHYMNPNHMDEAYAVEQEKKNDGGING